MKREKKICFISLGNLYLSPYLKKYEDIIDCKYDIIYWNRHGIKEGSRVDNLHIFQENLDEGSSKFAKLVGYLKFRKFVVKVIKDNNYEGIVLLQTSCGMLLINELKKYYKNRYIVDIRDYTKENNRLFYCLEKKLLKYAALSVISSKGYELFLPKQKYVLVHNDTFMASDVKSEFRRFEAGKQKIIISYIGLIRFHEQNKKVINKFKNDNRFELRFIGKDANALKQYCEINEITNVTLIDRFEPEETLSFYKDTDIIYNLYGNNTPLLDYALSNKLYYAANLGLPILVSPKTYMEKEAVGNGFGFSVDLENKKCLDDLYYYYNNINWGEFYSHCDKFLQQVNNDNKVFEEKIKQFINNI